jgi:hypothetical protein
VLFAPLYKTLKQSVVFGRGNRHSLRLGLEDQRRRSLDSRLRRSETGKSRGDKREKRYTSETESVHIELFS